MPSWIAAVGIVLPMIGASSASLETEGYRRFSSQCGTRSAWEHERRVETYLGSWSSVDAGELTVFISAVDGLVDSVLVFARNDDIGLMRVGEEQCRTSETWMTHDGVDVTTQHCGDVFIEQRVHAYEATAPELTCDSARNVRKLWRSIVEREQ